MKMTNVASATTVLDGIFGVNFSLGPPTRELSPSLVKLPMTLGGGLALLLPDGLDLSAMVDGFKK
jgi:hypothetical protein